MNKRISIALFIFLFPFVGVCQLTVQLVIHAVPEGTLPGNEIYVAGSFNNWDPADKGFRFTKQGDTYVLDMKLAAGNYAYKITQGSWDKVECNAAGDDIGNRQFLATSDTVIRIDIASWKTAGKKNIKKSTASSHVQILNTAFFLPQLNRKRRIWIYLPAGYTGTAQRYPVLYMQDGQNVFEDSSSYAGEWGVDEALDSLGPASKACIVIAIDHGGARRMNEYCPYDFSGNPTAGSTDKAKGEGDEYVDFLVKTLKPYVDGHFRTLKDKKNTFIAGSSMGGLIAFYAVLKYPKVFGGAGVFSPSFWVAPSIYDDIEKRGYKINSRLYFYMGGEEGYSMLPDMEKACRELQEVSPAYIKKVIRQDGQHNEASWRRDFPEFYQWILQD